MENSTGSGFAPAAHDRDHALWVIQVWLKHFLAAKRSLNVLRHHKEKVRATLDLLSRAQAADSIDDAQRLLFPEASMKLVVQILSVLPKDSLAKERNSDVMMGRKLLTGVLIAAFADEMLGNSSPGAARSVALKAKSIAVRHSASILQRQLQKLLKALLAPDAPKLHVFRRLLWQFQFATRHYLEKFKEWKALDAELLQQSMEETFAQSYQNLLMAKVAARRGDADDAIVAAAQMQSDRLRDVLRQILGPQKAASHVEEIVASIESSFPEYVRLFGEAAGAGGAAPRRVSAEPSRSEAAPSAVDAAATTAPSLVDTTELRRTLTPIPPDSGPSPTPSAVTAAAAVASATPEANAASSASEGASSANAGGMSDAESSKYLQLLSQLAGIENERLAHELTLDKFFRLPTKPATRLPPGQKPSLAHVLRTKLLNVMADKLVSALRRSNVRSVDDLAVGMVVPVKLSARPAAPPPQGAAADEQPATDFYTLTAEILNIKRAPDAAPDVAPEAATEAASWRLTVRYLSDDSVEDDVPAASRVKLAAEPPDARPLIAALADVAQAIAAFAPSRGELRQQLQSLFDAELLRQVAAQGTLQPTRDVLPVLLGLQRTLLALQAEYRLEAALAWLRAFEALFRRVVDASGAADAALDAAAAADERPLWLQARQRFYALRPVAPADRDEWLALLPLFLERTTENLEDIQRDMANFYIAQLVPVLQTHGRSFLAQRFRERLAAGLVSLDRTALWLQWQLTPETQLDAALAQLPPPFPQLWASVRPALGLQAVATAVREAEVELPGGVGALSLAALAAGDAAAAGESLATPTAAVVASALCALLQLPVRLDQTQPPQRAVAPYVLPEVFGWDASRLARLRDDVDLIALECGITLSVRQMLQQRYRVAHVDAEEVELQHRLDVLLRSHTADDAVAADDEPLETGAGASLEHLVAEVVRYAEYAIRRSRNGAASSGAGTAAAEGAASPATPAAPAVATYDVREVTAVVEKLLREVVVHEASPVLQLFTKRVYRVLFRACLGVPFAHKLPALSLHSTAQTRNLTTLVDRAVALFRHTMAVHGDVYREVVRALAQKMLAQQQTQQTQAGERPAGDVPAGAG